MSTVTFSAAMPAGQVVHGQAWTVRTPRGSPPISMAPARAQDWRQPLALPPEPAAWSPRSGAVPVAIQQKGGTQTLLMFLFTGAVMLMGTYLADLLSGLGRWSYLAVGLVELTDSATPFIPTPAHTFTYAVAGAWNPLLVALFATIGSTFGETVGFIAGTNGGKAIQQSRLFNYCSSFFGVYKVRFIIALAAVPRPVYLAGVWAGAFGISFRHFLAYAFCGKLILFMTIAVLGFMQA